MHSEAVSIQQTVRQATEPEFSKSAVTAPAMYTGTIVSTNAETDSSKVSSKLVAANPPPD